MDSLISLCVRAVLTAWFDPQNDEGHKRYVEFRNLRGE